MVRKFFKDSAIYGLGIILSKGLTVLMLPIYTAYLSKTQVGVLDLLLGVMAVLSMLIGLDMSNALVREYGEPGKLEPQASGRKITKRCRNYRGETCGMAAGSCAFRNSLSIRPAALSVVKNVKIFPR